MRQFNPQPSPAGRQMALRLGLLGTLLTSLCLPAWAAYKVIGPDGRVTYTDRPPSSQAVPAARIGSGDAPSPALPYELQQLVQRHPVTLFTSKDCAPCEIGRQLLRSRGVPYTEKTVDTPEDIRAFREREGSDQLPTLRIGKQQLVGLQQSEWTSYLDAAGYPATSTLPAGYRAPAPSPLAPAAARNEAPAAAPRASTPPTSPPPGGNAPPGFRF